MNRPAIHEIDHHIRQLTQAHLSPKQLTSLLQAALAQSKKSTVETAEKTITTEFGAAALLIWEITWQRLTAESTDSTPTDSTPTSSTPTSSDTAAMLNQQLQQLCLVWAYRRYRQISFNTPDDLFQTGFTTNAIQAMWRHPEIYAAINTTTRAKASQTTSDKSSQLRLHQYPTCWAYVFGCVIYQLLQWNHSLTSYQLWELFEQPPACPDALLPPPSSAKQPLPQTLSHSACLQQVA